MPRPNDDVDPLWGYGDHDEEEEPEVEICDNCDADIEDGKSEVCSRCSGVFCIGCLRDHDCT